MPRSPRALTEIMSNPGNLAALVDRVREQARLLARVRQELDSLISTHLVAAAIFDRKLILYADSSAWASRLRFGSRLLRDTLVRKGLEVEKITVRITLTAGSKPRDTRVARQLSRRNGLLIEKTAEAIDDPELRKALKRLSRHGR